MSTASQCSACLLPVSRGEQLCAECSDAAQYIEGAEEIAMGTKTNKTERSTEKTTTGRRVHRAVVVEAEPAAPETAVAEPGGELTFIVEDEEKLGPDYSGADADGAEEAPAPPKEASEEPAAPETAELPADGGDRSKRRKKLSELPASHRRRVAVWMLKAAIQTTDEDWAEWGIEGMGAARAILQRALQKVSDAKAKPKVRNGVGPGAFVRIVEKARTDYLDVLDEGDLDGIEVIALGKGSARCRLASGGKAVLPVRVLEAVS